MWVVAVCRPWKEAARDSMQRVMGSRGRVVEEEVRYWFVVVSLPVLTAERWKVSLLGGVLVLGRGEVECGIGLR